MLELLILGIVIALPFRLLFRRQKRRQGRIAAAYDRARFVRVTEADARRGLSGQCGERVYNLR